MTISSITNKAIHIGDGAIFSFPYNYRMDNDSDMEVYLDDVLQQSGYVVNRGLDDIGGVVNFTVPPAADAIVTLLRVVPYTQETDYVPYDAFPAEAHEDALDKLTMEIQQIQEQVDRNTQNIGSGEGIDTSAPPFDANKAWKWDNGAEKKLINSTYDPDEQVVLASGFADNSFSSSNNSAISASESLASKDFSQAWSSEEEDVPVDDGINVGFSSYHWSKKSEGAIAGVSSINGESGIVVRFQKQDESMPGGMWDASRDYLVGDLVTLNQLTYISITNNVGKDPEVELTDWQIALEKDVSVSYVAEIQSLSDGQDVVVFENEVSPASFYLSGKNVDAGRLVLGIDIVVDKPTKTATLTSTYPEGTFLNLVYGVDEGGSIISGVSSVNTRTGDVLLVSSDVALGNVDNTSDINKPISSATQNALDLKATLLSPTFSGEPTSPTPVDNTTPNAIATTQYVADNSGGGGGGQVNSVIGGIDISVDSSDPINPIVNYVGSGGGGSEFPSGTVMVFYQDTPPIGWSLVGGIEDSMLTVGTVGGGESGGVDSPIEEHSHLGPSHSHASPTHLHTISHTHTVNSHSHTIAHTHTVSSHSHTIAHTHNIADHNHPMPHTHATSGLSLIENNLPPHGHSYVNGAGDSVEVQSGTGTVVAKLTNTASSTGNIGGGTSHNHGNTSQTAAPNTSNTSLDTEGSSASSSGSTSGDTGASSASSSGTMTGGTGDSSSSNSGTTNPGNTGNSGNTSTSMSFSPKFITVVVGVKD